MPLISIRVGSGRLTAPDTVGTQTITGTLTLEGSTKIEFDPTLYARGATPYNVFTVFKYATLVLPAGVTDVNQVLVATNLAQIGWASAVFSTVGMSIVVTFS